VKMSINVYMVVLQNVILDASYAGLSLGLLTCPNCILYKWTHLAATAGRVFIIVSN
jgi:hypothetical protein